jgi:hypothetical protein
MRIDVERFLTITAILAAGTAVAAGCGSEDVENNPRNDSGISGAGGRGGSSGRGGTSGSAGSSGRGGTSGSSGSGGTAGSGGTSDAGDASVDGRVDGSAGTGGSAGADGAACLGGETSTTPDAGAEECADLPYASQTCGDGGTSLPAGLDLCRYMAETGRTAVFSALKTCLTNVGDAGTACSAAHDTAVQTCIDTVFPQACDGVSTTLGDAAVVTCTDVSAACGPEDGGPSPLTVGDCENSLHAFTPAARKLILECFDRNDQGACVDTFEICLFDPAYDEP